MAPEASAAWSMAFGMACVAALVASALLGRVRAALVVSFALLGACVGWGEASSVSADSCKSSDADWSDVRIVLAEDSRQAAFGESALVEAVSADGVSIVAQADFGDGEPLLIGDVFSCQAVFTGPDWQKDRYLWQSGAAGRLRVSGLQRVDDAGPLTLLRAARRRAIEAFGSDDDVHALLQALACGYRREARQTELYTAFQTCGLAHLVAVSGAHLTLVTGMFALALQALRVPRSLSTAILIAVMGAYVVLAGFPVSAIRAMVMASVGVLALLGKRRPSAQNALGLGALCIVCAHPSAALSVSFALSALSTSGIVLFSPLVSSWLDAIGLRGVPILRDSAALTVSAGIASQLYACAVFHQLPLVSLLANAGCALLFPPLCAFALLAAVASCFGSGAAGAALFLANALGGIMKAVVTSLSALPYASVPLALDMQQALGITVCATVALWLSWPSLRPGPTLAAAGALLLGALLLAVPGYLEDSLTMLDIGQGDALLLKSGGKTLLVDTGNHDGQLLEQLGRCGVLKVDSVLLTHSDDDHVGSLDALDRAVQIERVIVAEGLQCSAEPKNEALIEQARHSAPELVCVDQGDCFRLGAFAVNVIWPKGLSDEGGNADSIVLRVDYRPDADGEVLFSALLTGDAEKEQLAAMMEEGQVGRVDVLKAGHHGSRNGMTVDQARALSPRIALISVGAGNRYGHPAAETLEQLEEVGARVYRTDVDGQVKCTFSPDSLDVSLK